MTEPYRSMRERRPLVDECMSLKLESQTLAVAVAGANYLVGSDEGLHSGGNCVWTGPLDHNTSKEEYKLLRNYN